jgi:hypothetical protein
MLVTSRAPATGLSSILISYAPHILANPSPWLSETASAMASVHRSRHLTAGAPRAGSILTAPLLESLKVYVFGLCMHVVQSLAPDGMVVGGGGGAEFAHRESGGKSDEAVSTAITDLIHSSAPESSELLDNCDRLMLTRHRLACGWPSSKVDHRNLPGDVPPQLVTAAQSHDIVIYPKLTESYVGRLVTMRRDEAKILTGIHLTWYRAQSQLAIQRKVVVKGNSEQAADFGTLQFLRHRIIQVLGCCSRWGTWMLAKLSLL